MSRRKKILSTLTFILTALLWLSACGNNATSEVVVTPSPQPSPTATSEPLFTEPLTICTASEPNTLHPYNFPNSSAQNVLEIVYDGPVSQNILLPTPAQVTVNPVLVSQGSMILDAYDQLQALYPGVTYLPAGCSSMDCATTYSEGDVEVSQMQVIYTIATDVLWADGEPVKASDSLYAYQLNASEDVAGDDYVIQRTQSYEAPDAATLRWTGIPGYIDTTPQDNFWLPLPEHLWGGVSPAETLTLPEASQTPLGWGPFYVSEWLPGEHISFSRNPYYPFTALADPYKSFEIVILRFVGDDAQANLKALQNGDCDILDPSTTAEGQDYPQNPENINLFTANSTTWEHLDFGIVPQNYDDGYQVFNDRADFFGDVRARQAFAACIDQQSLAEAFAQGQAEALMNSFILPQSALALGAQTPAYDVQAGNQLLDEVGWVMAEDGIRYAVGVENLLDSTPFSITYLTTDDAMHTALGNMIAEDLAACGVQVNLQTMASESLFATGSGAPLFGRNFDLAQFSWDSGNEPFCSLFSGEAVPGDNPDIFPYAWGGWNLTGWQNGDYDQACQSAQNLPVSSEEAFSKYETAQQIFMEQYPVIPLFVHQQVALTRPDMCGFTLDASLGMYWNIENIGFGELCSQ